MNNSRISNLKRRLEALESKASYRNHEISNHGIELLKEAHRMVYGEKVPFELTAKYEDITKPIRLLDIAAELLRK